MLRLAALALLTCSLCSAHIYDYVYMKDQCNGRHDLSIADKIIYSSFSGYPAGECVFTLSADFNKRIILNFYEIDTGSLDTIDIYDGPSTTYSKLNSFSLSGYNYSPSNAYRSSGRYLTIRFYAWSTSFSNDGFKAAATEFTTGSCDVFDYKCCNGDCIDDDLRYDGVDNCKDNSDEWNVSGCMNTAAIVGVVVGVSVFSIFFITLCACFVARRRRNRRANAVVVSQGYPNYAATGGNTFVQQPAPVYQQQAGFYQQPAGVYQQPAGGYQQPAGTVNQLPPAGAVMQPPPYAAQSKEQTEPVVQK